VTTGVGGADGHPIPSDRARELVRGGYDTHVHIAPDVVRRRASDVALARRFAELGLAGFGLKSHYTSTAERARVVSEAVPEVDTIGTLCRRIDERFPDSGLGNVCRELLTIAGESQKRSAWIAKPQRPLRIIVWILLIIMAGGLITILTHAGWPRGGFELVGLVQGLEAALNITILLGAAALFLVTVEVRIKRKRALKAIHELRALAHVIDMHQLTKDPEPLRVHGQATPSSPKRTLRAPELIRYLDYCSEMLSLIGKLAALYVQKFDDPVALAAVNEVEDLTTGLSRKIWQKIMIVNAFLAKELV